MLINKVVTNQATNYVKESRSRGTASPFAAQEIPLSSTSFYLLSNIINSMLLDLCGISSTFTSSNNKIWRKYYNLR